MGGEKRQKSPKFEVWKQKANNSANIIKLSSKYGKPLGNLVMSLSSYSSAKRVTSLSESPMYDYQYSSICDVIHI